MTLPFDFRAELEKLRWLEKKALEADNAVLRQRLKIFPPVEAECAKALSAMDQIKDQTIMAAIKSHGSKSAAADALGIGRSTVYKRMRALKVNGFGMILMLALSLFGAGTNEFQAPGTIILAWDPSPPCNGCSTNLGYRLYAHTNAITATNLYQSLVRVDAGTNLTARVQNMAHGLWYFAATAYNEWNIESVPSDNLAVSVPEKPANMRTVVLQWNATVDGTNWLDAGFFKVKIGP